MDFQVLILMVMVLGSWGVMGQQLRRLEVDILRSVGYSSYAGEQVFWMLNWKENDRTITNINHQQIYTFSAHHNQFSHLSFREMQETYLTLRVTQGIDIRVQAPDKRQSKLLFAPTQFILPYQSPVEKNTIDVDWRRKGAVSEVGNQGSCGACWAFAATSQIQSQLHLELNLDVSLSQQQLIDCSQLYGNIGCRGGMMDNAFRYIISNGVTLKSLYPYESKIGQCRYDQSAMTSYSVKKSKIIFGDCRALKELLITKPVTVVVSVNLLFIFYDDGVLNSCGDEINHAIQLVGYFKNSTQQYYIGKNSWGKGWGKQGFIKIDANTQKGNLCNVCAYPQYTQ